MALDYRLELSRSKLEPECSAIKTSNLEEREISKLIFLGLAKIHKLQLFLPLPPVPPSTNSVGSGRAIFRTRKPDPEI